MKFLNSLKKVVSKLLVLSLFLMAIPSQQAFAADITFTDASLETCIREALLIAEPTPITDVNAQSLTSLICEGDLISDLSGLEYFTNLTTLSIRNNEVTDISEISGLLNLEDLYIDNNQITTIDALSGLHSLLYLHAGNNPINSIAPLSGLTSLTQLFLEEISTYNVGVLMGLTSLTDLSFSGNNVGDLSGLNSLTSLEFLNLERNDITDLHDLLDNSGMGVGDVVYLDCNPLDDNASAQIVALGALGVIVHYDATLEGCPGDGLTMTNAWITDMGGSNQVYALFSANGIPSGELADYVSIEGGAGATHAELQTGDIEYNGTTYSDRIIVATFADEVRSGDVLLVNTETVQSVEVAYYDDGIPDEITFNDANLEACLREALGIESPTPITSDDALTENAIGCVQMGITDLTGLEYFTGAFSVSLWGNEISDISVLAQLPNIQWLSLHQNNISDLSPLSGLTGLINLSLYENTISNINTVDWSNKNALTQLYLNGNTITDISAFSDIPSSLDYLNLSDNTISNISPLSELTTVTILYLFGNSIVDISPLSTLINLTGLYLDDNLIVDISPLEVLTALNTLHLFTNSIVDIQPLVDNAGIGDGDTLTLQDNDLSEESIVLIQQLIDREVDVTYDENNDAADFSVPTGDDHEFTINLSEWGDYVTGPIGIAFVYGNENFGSSPDGLVIISEPSLPDMITAYVPHVEGQTNVSMFVVTWSGGDTQQDPDIAWYYGESHEITGDGPTVIDMDLNSQSYASGIFSAVLEGTSGSEVTVTFVDLIDMNDGGLVSFFEDESVWSVDGASPISAVVVDEYTVRLTFNRVYAEDELLMDLSSMYEFPVMSTTVIQGTDDGDEDSGSGGGGGYVKKVVVEIDPELSDETPETTVVEEITEQIVEVATDVKTDTEEKAEAEGKAAEEEKNVAEVETKVEELFTLDLGEDSETPSGETSEEAKAILDSVKEIFAGDKDADNDGISNEDEIKNGTDPLINNDGTIKDVFTKQEDSTVAKLKVASVSSDGFILSGTAKANSEVSVKVGKNIFKTMSDTNGHYLIPVELENAEGLFAVETTVDGVTSKVLVKSQESTLPRPDVNIKGNNITQFKTFDLNALIKYVKDSKEYKNEWTKGNNVYSLSTLIGSTIEKKVKVTFEIDGDRNLRNGKMIVQGTATPGSTVILAYKSVIYSSVVIADKNGNFTAEVPKDLAAEFKADKDLNEVEHQLIAFAVDYKTNKVSPFVRDLFKMYK